MRLLPLIYILQLLFKILDAHIVAIYFLSLAITCLTLSFTKYR